MIIVKLFIGLFFAWLLGHFIVYLFDPKKILPMIESAALSYLIGQGSITLILFLLFLLPIAHQSMIVSMLIIALFILKLFVDKNWRRINPAVIMDGLKHIFWHRKKIIYGLLLLILFSSFFIKISYSFIEACSKPEYAWDASGNWTLLGKNCFYADKYQPDKVLGELKSHVSGYPRAVSLMHYWLFWWMGEANDQWSKIIFPIELICLFIVFYYGLKPARGQLGAAVFTYFLCSAPIFFYHSTIGYADLTKTVYFTAGIICFFRWLQTKQDSYFWFFAVNMAFTTWVKMEGKALYAIGLVLLLFYLWCGWQGSLKNKIIYVGHYLFLFIIIGLPWQLFIMLNHSNDPQGAVSVAFSNFFEFHGKMYSLMFLEGSWGLFWVIAAAGLLFFFKKQLTNENLYLFIAIVLFYGNLVFIYLFFKESVSAMVATFNRVLLPIYPVAVFDLGCILPQLRIDREIVI